MLDTKGFIDKYEKYYFRETYEKNDKLGIKGLKPVSEESEREIIEKLKNGIHDEKIIAWKIGGYKPGKDIVASAIRGSYGSYDVSEYLKNATENRNIIEKNINSAIMTMKRGSIFDGVECLSKAFEILNNCNKPSGFGTVYIINSLFFLSKGEIPIYDKNVYKAVQALYLNKEPYEITVSEAPTASDSTGAVFRLLEYMWLLDKIFTDSKKEKSKQFPKCEHVGYISRGLDRALWVFGQKKNLSKGADE